MKRSFTLLAAAIVFALLVMLGVSLTGESVVGAMLCFAASLTIATWRWPKGRTIASSATGVLAFIASTKFFVATLADPSAKTLLFAIGLLAMGTWGLVDAWRMRFGFRQAPFKT